jgi:serine/threonine protein kinase
MFGIGQQLGNYCLLRLLGQGGFADVYLGEHIHLNTQAAIKVLQVQIVSDDTSSFRTEARTIAHLKHRHIVPILDFDIENDTPFLIMEYAPNGTLRQRHPRGTTVPLPSVISYTEQIASALYEAHSHNLTHRDVKPENMLLRQDNVVLLSDFGIAAVAQNTNNTGQQGAAGTGPYMAPEQIQGLPCAASDQYALAIVVYEWLTGTLPFTGTYMEVISQHLKATPPSMRQKIPTIPPGVEEVVMLALSKDPRQRFASVRAFASALDHAGRAGLSMPSPRSVDSSPRFENTTRGQTMETAINGPSGRMLISASVTTLGSMYDNSYVISDPSVSPHHAEIRLDRQGYTITDLSSTSGTFVNNQRLNREVPHHLRQGDIIRVGNIPLLFEMNSTPADQLPTPSNFLSESNRPTVLTPGHDPNRVASSPSSPSPSGNIHNSNPDAAIGARVSAQIPTPPPAPPITDERPNPTPGNHNTPVITPYGAVPYQTGNMSNQSGTIPNFTPSSASQYNPVIPPSSTFTPQQPPKQKRWLLIGAAVVLLVALLAGGIMFYVTTLPTAAKTLDTFCTSLQNKDYQTAYTQLSSKYKSTISSSVFQSFYANVSSCTHSAPTQTADGSTSSTSSLTTTATGHPNNDTATLTQDNGAWQISDIANLSAITKTLNTFCQAWQQGDYPTAYNQLTGQMQSKLTEQQMNNFFPKVTSCGYDSVASTAKGAMITLNDTTASGQAETNTVNLDSSNSWKISSFSSLPDNTLDAFCSDIQSENYQAAYNEFSAGLQTVKSETQFAKDWAGTTTCTHTPSTASSNSTITAMVMLGSGAGNELQATLIQDSTGQWKIDSLTFLPDVPLVNFCNGLQQKDYQGAYDQFSDAAKSQLSESLFAQDFSGVTTCTYTNANVNGNIATSTMTLGGSNGNTISLSITLAPDSNGDWKIENMQKA